LANQENSSLLYKTFDREQYLKYHNTMIGEDKKFSKVAIGMWDFMKAWEKWPVRILEDNGEIISVCFMKLSGQAKSKVLFISNIFTPKEGRGKGSAREMLHRNILEAVSLGATSIRLDCNQKALGFYDKIGLTYWGTTISKSMFCDLPINERGLDGIKDLKNKSAIEILNTYSPELKAAKLKWIAKKVKKHKEFDFGHPSRYEEYLSLLDFQTLEGI
jgi:GNAT superfamily N-acetyltransferase